MKVIINKQKSRTESNQFIINGRNTADPMEIVEGLNKFCIHVGLHSPVKLKIKIVYALQHANRASTLTAR